MANNSNGYNNFTDFPYQAYGNAHGTLFFKRYALSQDKGEVQFPAFIESFNENYVSNWERQTVFGRSDPMQFYGGTQRTINVSFTLVASSVNIAKLQLTSLDQLIKYLYPNYAQGAYTSPPMIGVKYENLIRDGGDFLVGTMGNFSITPNFEEGVFTPRNDVVPGMQGTGQVDMMEVYPQTIQLAFDFYPIHRDTLGWEYGNWTGEDFHQVRHDPKKLSEGTAQLQEIFKDMFGETVESADALQALADFSEITQEELEKIKKEQIAKKILGTPPNAYANSSIDDMLQSQKALNVAKAKAQKAGDKNLISFFEKRQEELNRAMFSKIGAGE